MLSVVTDEHNRQSTDAAVVQRREVASIWIEDGLSVAIFAILNVLKRNAAY